MKRPLLIIAHGITNNVVDSLTINRNSGGTDVCVVLTPGYDQDREDFAEDIAAACGAR